MLTSVTLYTSYMATALYWTEASLSKCWFSMSLSSRCLATCAITTALGAQDIS